MSVGQALNRLYPYKSFLTKDGQKMVEDLMKTFDIDFSSLSSENIPISIKSNESCIDENYVATNYHQHVVQELEDSIKIHDICLIGARGSGKSTLIKQLAKRLSLEIEPIMLYQVNEMFSTSL